MIRQLGAQGVGVLLISMKDDCAKSGVVLISKLALKSAQLASLLLICLFPMSCGGGGGPFQINSVLKPNGLSAIPNNLPFGDVRVGASSAQTVIIQNNGTSGVTVSSVVVTGQGFAVINEPSVPFTVAAGHIVNLTSQFSPSSAGSSNGSITVTGSMNQSASMSNTTSVTIFLSGNGVTASLVASPPAVGFGNVVVGSNSTQQVQLSLSLSQASSPSSISVMVSSANLTGTAFSLPNDPFPVMLSGSQTVSFSVQYSPQVVGSSSGSVSLVSDASNSPTVVPLSGNGVTTTHSVTLQWDQPNAVTGVTVNGYNIYRANFTPSSGCPPAVTSTSPAPGYTQVGSSSGVSTTTFSDDTVAGGRTYCYYVTSVASTGESVPSGVVEAVVPSP